MYPRIFSTPKGKNKSYFIFGPRGTGKSTWIKEELKPDVLIDLLDDEVYNYLLANPKRLSEYITSNKPKCIVIDEIQKIPSLMDEVHRLIETKKWKFVLTGSSARKLKKSHCNLLAGRALTTHFYPLTAMELGKEFSLINSIKWGHLPSITKEAEKERYLKSYITTYLKEEIMQEGLMRNIQAFARFLEIASFSQASIINASNIAREVGKDSKIIEDYFQILEDLLIGVRLPVFLKKAKRKMISKNKFYYFDVGVFRAIRPMGPLDDTGSINGQALETLVFQEIRALNEHLDWKFTISYWHTQDHKEIDFILYGELGLFAIEVKLSSKYHLEDFKALKTFKEDYPMSRLIFLYTGEHEMRVEEIDIIPVQKFLIQPAKYLFKK